MSLPELLQQWAEVGDETIGYDFEYDRGLVERMGHRVLPPRLTDQWHVVHGRKSFGGTPGDPAFDAHVLAAVIEAIEARTGDWSLVSGYSAIVTHVTRVDGTLRVGSVIGPDRRTPAEALLAAYLKAVRHQETGEQA